MMQAPLHARRGKVYGCHVCRRGQLAPRWMAIASLFMVAPLSCARSTDRIHPARDHWQQPFTRVVVLGESTVEGGGWVPAQADRYADILVGLINRVQVKPVEYLNRGIGASVISPLSPGYAASRKPSAMERYRTEVIAAQPDLVIIAYGLNDMRAGMDVDIFISELEVIVRDVQSSCSALVVLVNVYHMTGYDWYPPFDRGSIAATATYNSAIRRLAERSGSLYADVYSAQACADWVVHQDGVHANQIGNILIANKIFEVIANQCSGLASDVRRHDENTEWTKATRRRRS